MKYPRLLSTGANNKVIALNDEEVAKLFEAGSRSDLGSEAAKMQFANQVNGLVAKFIRLDYNENLQSEMLVMERIFPIDYRALEVEKRLLFLEVFLDEIKQLHDAGFVHRYIKRPSSISGQPYDNILLTTQGLRLIDVGISALRSQVSARIFDKYLEVEQAELAEFAQYFLER